MKTYASTADELVTHIREVAKTQPQILKCESPWDMFKIEGFKCNDLEPSLFQASWALAKAIELGPL